MPIAPTSGLMSPFTTELTMFVKAAPMTTATARSTTFPRIRKVLNPCQTPGSFFFSLNSEPLLARARCGTNSSATYVKAWPPCPIR
ncbi:hypothetical protein ACRAWF_46665 [Streptomyces sp. L7]